MAVLLVIAGTPAAWPQQVLVACVTVTFALLLGRLPRSYIATLMLVILSCASTVRYGVWRVLTVSHFLHGSGMHPPAQDIGFSLLVLAAEVYSFLNLGLGYFQMVWPLRRAPVSLPQDAELWPEVDVLIPSLNEPLEVVKYTALAALNMDWPPEKLNVYVLDDGRREEVRGFCAEAGIGYMIRENNEGAKAGNLNRALERTSAPLVAVFDADHVPVRSFLQLTAGWFERDPMLGLLQTPHHLYSPDPFERNLDQFRAVPNEGELFYGVVQDGNDLWNSTYFCGTGAVLRRAALDSVGGVATETVTEDAHTSLRMQKKGWNTAYINLPLAAGLATERLSSHIRQRRRWARGMVQVLRLENPLCTRGLTWPQRLCYFHAAAYFLNALPRLIFLIAPFIYLVLGDATIPGYWVAVVAYAAPHLALGYVANARLHGAHRFSFWNEIYETVLAPFLVFPTLKGLFSSRAVRFDVTQKGDVVESGFFDSRTALPLVVLFGANFLGLMGAALRLVALPAGGSLGRVPHLALHWAGMLHQGRNAGAVWVNVAWSLFNLMILSVAIGVARETRQRRRSVRLHKCVKAALVFSDGRWLQGTTEDVSSGGLLIRSAGPVDAGVNEAVSLVLSVQGLETVLPATVVEAMPRALRLHFDPLTLREEEALTMILFSAADSWTGWGTAIETDRPLKSLGRIAGLALTGISRALGSQREAPAALRIVALVLCLLLLSVAGVLSSASRLRAQQSPRVAAAGVAEKDKGQQDAPVRRTVQTAQGKTEKLLSLSEIAGAAPIVLKAAGGSREMHFSVAMNEVIEQAELRLRLRSEGKATDQASFQVLLNGVPLAVNPGAGEEKGGRVPDSAGQAPWRDLRLTLPPELLVHDNHLLLRFVQSGRPVCGTPGCDGETVEIATQASALDLISRSFAISAGPARRPRTAGESSRSRYAPGVWIRQRIAACRQWASSSVTGSAALAALLFACVAFLCLALAWMLRAGLRERAWMRLNF